MSQRTCQEQLVHATAGFITNIRIHPHRFKASAIVQSTTSHVWLVDFSSLCSFL
jgi:hypothetical protein